MKNELKCAGFGLSVCVEYIKEDTISPLQTYERPVFRRLPAICSLFLHFSSNAISFNCTRRHAFYRLRLQFLDEMIQSPVTLKCANSIFH